MKLKELLRKGNDRLHEAGITEAQIEAVSALEDIRFAGRFKAEEKPYAK